MKNLIFFAALLFSSSAFSQDTIYVKKVKVENHLLDKKGTVLKTWQHSVRVKSGYIVHQKNDIWKVNGKQVHFIEYSPSPKHKIR